MIVSPNFIIYPERRSQVLLLDYHICGSESKLQPEAGMLCITQDTLENESSKLEIYLFEPCPKLHATFTELSVRYIWQEFYKYNLYIQSTTFSSNLLRYDVKLHHRYSQRQSLEDTYWLDTLYSKGMKYKTYDCQYGMKASLRQDQNWIKPRSCSSY